jgi:hypothetical protein
MTEPVTTLAAVVLGGAPPWRVTLFWTGFWLVRWVVLGRRFGSGSAVRSASSHGSWSRGLVVVVGQACVVRCRAGSDNAQRAAARTAWWIYTSAWRRLKECQGRGEAAGHWTADAGDVPDVASGPVSRLDLQMLLGTFITVDEARHEPEGYVQDRATQGVRLSHLELDEGEVLAALERNVGHSVGVDAWRDRLLLSAKP